MINVEMKKQMVDNINNEIAEGFEYALNSSMPNPSEASKYIYA
jgi:hypothetical protein